MIVNEHKLIFFPIEQQSVIRTSIYIQLSLLLHFFKERMRIGQLNLCSLCIKQNMNEIYLFTMQINSRQGLFLLLITLFSLSVGISARSAPMEASYNNKYIYTSVFKVPVSGIIIDSNKLRSKAEYSIPFPVALKKLSHSSIALSLGSVKLEMPVGLADLIRGITRGVASFKLTLMSAVFKNYRILEMRYVIFSGKYEVITNPNMVFMSFNYKGKAMNQTTYRQFSANLPSHLNHTGGMRHFCSLAGFSLVSASKYIKTVDIDLRIFRVNSTKVVFHLFSHSKTNTTVVVLQIAFMLYNAGYMNQQRVGRFDSNHFLVSELTPKKSLKYVNRGNVLDFTTMIGISGFHADATLQFYTIFDNPDSFTISTKRKHNFISVHYMLMATFYCGYETPYYYAGNNRCYDVCPGTSERNLVELTCQSRVDTRDQLLGGLN